MKNNFTLHSFKSSEELVSTLCEKIVHALGSAIEQRGHAAIALSGGSTPKKLFEKLSAADLEWEKVTVTLVDERWVDSSSADSNENLVVNTLLQNRASFARFIPLKNSAVEVEDGVLITANRLKEIERLDVVVLGMGGDGHTASFFPHAKGLENALSTQELCCATEATVAPYSRITLSRSFLLTTEHLFLHIEGEKKREVFDLACAVSESEEVLSGCGSSDVQEMPIISMMQQKEPKLEVYYA